MGSAVANLSSGYAPVSQDVCCFRHFGPEILVLKMPYQWLGLGQCSAGNILFRLLGIFSIHFVEPTEINSTFSSQFYPMWRVMSLRDGPPGGREALFSMRPFIASRYDKANTGSSGLLLPPHSHHSTPPASESHL